MEIEAYDIKEPDFNKNKATVSIELSENENYTLYGYFINNFHCGKIALFEFEGTKYSNYSLENYCLFYYSSPSLNPLLSQFSLKFLLYKNIRCLQK